MDKQENPKASIPTPSSKVTPDRDINQLILELQSFIESFDPYSPVSSKDEAYLRSLDIYDIEDPFKVTNQLISRIEDLIERNRK
jgi:hypothetical protein